MKPVPLDSSCHAGLEINPGDGLPTGWIRAEKKGPPQRCTPSRPWANLASPKPPKQASAKSGDFGEGKRKVEEAVLAEPEPLQFVEPSEVDKP